MYCQKCRCPLKSESSLDDLNPAAFDILIGAADQSRTWPNAEFNLSQERKARYDVVSGQSALYKRSIPAPRTEDRTGMSFIEITESQVVPTNPDQAEVRHVQNTPASAKVKDSLSWQLKRHENLFAILSSRSDIDHPICIECSGMLINQLNVKLSATTRERDAYSSFLKTLQQSSAQTEDSKAAEKELEDLIHEEERYHQELLKLEEEKRVLDAELGGLGEESKRLDHEEKHFWESQNAFNDKLYEVEIELETLQEKYAHDQNQLEKLQRTNVYNDTFCIGHDGFFGTINGLRLGRLPNQNVEWAEINAAWGQTLLLLATVAERLGFTFSEYRLRPLGSTSRIEKSETTQSLTSTVKVFDLFSSGDLPLGRVFNHRRFDAGMVAFLDCLSQLGSHVEQTSKNSGRSNSLLLPYSIQGDKIGDVSIRLGVGFSQDENFTKACKYALTCCKFLLAHVSNLDSSK